MTLKSYDDPKIKPLNFRPLKMRPLFRSSFLATIKNKTLAQQLTPDFRLGCKRILFADDYYSSMNDDRFELETDQIEKFTENGIKTSGKNHEFDLIIMATGFKLCESTYTITVVIKL